MLRNIVNPALCQAYPYGEKTAHTAIWDVLPLPNGEVYVSFCTEGMPSGVNAHLAKWKPGAATLERCLDLRELTCQPLAGPQMPHSKIHTSMQFEAASGKIFFASYTTSPGLGHEFWDVFQQYDDPTAGFTGSYFAEYEVATGRYAAWGCPIPRQMIYGGLLDSRRRRYYYLSYPNGHLGYVNLTHRTFNDLGRVARRHTFILFTDSRGRIFGATREGQIWRYDPDRGADVELLNVFLPRRQSAKEGEIFIIHANPEMDGCIIGGCRGGNPLWRYNPDAGPEGSIQSLGNPVNDFEDGSCDTAWVPLQSADGYLYYWTAAAKGEDVSMVRLHIESGRREAMGYGFISGKPLGTWIGPGAIGRDGCLFWGDCGYYQPRLIRYDPALLGQIPAVTETAIAWPAQSRTPTGPNLLQHPIDASWSDIYVERERLKVIRICGDVAPRGGSAIASLAAGPDHRLYGICSGKEQTFFSLDAAGGAAPERLAVIAAAGASRHCLDFISNAEALFSWAPASPGASTPVLRFTLQSESKPEPFAIIDDEGAAALACDRIRQRLYLLTSLTNRLLIYDARGKLLRDCGSLGERQVSPLLVSVPDGAVYGAARGGRIWRIPPGGTEVETTGLSLPCQKGRAYCVEWQAAALHGNTLYGGSSDGYLFALILPESRIVNLGKPAHQSGLRALAATDDGTVYGAAGEAQTGMVRLFRHTQAEGFSDLGWPDSLTKPFGWSMRIASAVWLNGTVYWGEDCEISHLLAYAPEARPVFPQTPPAAMMPDQSVRHQVAQWSRSEVTTFDN